MSAPLPQTGIESLLHHIEQRRHRMTLNGGVELNAWGGAIGAVPTTATAFAHRRAQFLCLYDALWNDDAERDDNIQWLNGLYAAMAPYASGSYVNMSDPQLFDWRMSYYGENLHRLVAVKRTYDPDDFFRFEQSLPLALEQTSEKGDCRTRTRS